MEANILIAIIMFILIFIASRINSIAIVLGAV